MTTHRFIGTHGQEQRTIELEPHEGGRYRITVDDRAYEVDARQLEGGNWSLLIDGKSYDVELERTGDQESLGHYNALVWGKVVDLTVRDERHLRMGVGSGALSAEGPQVVLCPMPGKIVKLLVAVGDEVEANQPLVIVEAMKMENELRAPTSGKVSKISVEEGQAVEANAKLIALE